MYWTSNDRVAQLYELVRDLSEMISEQQSVTGQSLGLSLVLNSSVVEVGFLGTGVWSSEETDAETIEEVAQEIKTEIEKLMDAISRIDLGASLDGEGSLVRLTYFKETGKMNFVGEYRTKCEHSYEVIREVRQMVIEGTLPGMAGGAQRPPFILVDPVGLSERFPTLIT